MVASAFRELWSSVVGAVVPLGRECTLCGRRCPPSPSPPSPARQDGIGPFTAGLCADCRSRIPLVAPPLCRVCGKPLRCDSYDSPRCADCAAHPRHFLLARAAGLYDGLLRTAIHELKYRSRRNLAVPLGELAAEVALPEVAACLAGQAGEPPRRSPWTAVNPGVLLVPVPLHRERLLARGFNQAELLAVAIARASGLELETQAVERVPASSSPQSTLSAVARRSALRGAFVVSRPGVFSARRVIVVDDVMTTGTTADELARSILRAGALRVGVVTVAVGVTRADWLRRRSP